MKYFFFADKFAVSKQVAGAVVALCALSAACGGAAYAEPAHDTVTEIKDLSRQAEELSGAIQSAKVDLDKKLQLLAEADTRHAADLVALDAAKAELAVHQSAVDKLAAAVYVGGTRGSFTGLLSAPSPQILIDKLAFQRLMTTEMSDQLQAVRQVNQQAQTVAVASAESAAAAKSAVDQAVALRSDLQNKQSQLRSKIATVNADYAMLPQAQRAELTSALSPSVVAAMGLASPIPTVGMGGLVPAARSLAAYIMAAYPGVQSIGGVRSDPLPDHPSGHAIDIMIGSDMGLGDAINADVQSQMARFGVKYTMWRVANHYNHVHVTVN